IMPIRGHSGVQGGGECGVAPNKFPGGLAVSGDNASKFAQWWGHVVPSEPGLTTPMALRAASRGEIDILYNIGGNLIETMPDRKSVEATFGKIALRIHQDIVFNTSTLCEPGEAVLILPAQTRYEHAGGVTSTSTERRIRFSPEIPGPRIAEARAEWEIPALIGRAVLREGEKFFGYASTQQIREEMELTMPVYKGIASLRKEGDWIQWGGERLLEGGVCPKMPEGRGRFSVVHAAPKRPPEGMLTLTTRRGKQFNSMTHAEADPITGAKSRDTILIAEADALRLGVQDGNRIRLRSELGELTGLAQIADVHPGTVQAFWPEANRLIAQEFDPISNVPDYNAFVRIERIS
ncbi:molybdopterin-dependent oxidoreductase, partial [Candidatus Sumerlaeota bacterium]|nr:molybdopterin-dependent oxidoreductase [Candidatus Sumerlaeota bacterium]